MYVGECCNRTVVVAAPDTRVDDAARLMREYHVGSIVVVGAGEKPRPLGIVTDRDLVIEILAAGAPVERVTLADMIDGDLKTAEETEDLIETLERMREQGIRRMPVVNGEGELVGIMTADDVLSLLVGALGQIPHLVSRQQETELVRRP